MSHPEHETPQDLAAAYALGALSPEEARRFETYLADSPEARREVVEYRDVMALLALAGPEAAPSPDLRQRVLSRVRGHPARPGSEAASSSASSSARRLPAGWGALAAALVAVAGLGLGYVQLRDARDLRAELDRTQQRLSETSKLLSEREATLDAISGPGVRMFQLTASGNPDPAIQLFWDRERHSAVIRGFKLEPIPQGSAYQLWFIKDGAPVPSVTFKPGSDGRVSLVRIPVPAEGEVSAAAVTVEPESGSAQPTSPIRLVGTLDPS